MSDVLFGAGSVTDTYQQLLVPALFTPWARRLVDRAGVTSGHHVLDVATGTGVVAAASLERVGPAGRVVAADVSGAMLERAAAAAPGIETVLTSAADLSASGEFDVALCQQGLQFMADRGAAVSAMRRALRPGGTVAIAVWQSGQIVEPFDVYGQSLEAAGVPEPFPRAYSYDFCMSVEEMSSLLAAAGIQDVTVDIETLPILWPSIETVVSGISGTPYGPALAGCPADQQQRIATWLRDHLRVSHSSTVVVGRGSAPRT